MVLLYVTFLLFIISLIILAKLKNQIGFWMLIIPSSIFLIVQGFATATMWDSSTQIIKKQIVSNNDGIFINSATVNGIQSYSYYVKNNNGSYSLESQDTLDSYVWTDAKPEDSRIEITEDVSTCRESWWAICIATDIRSKVRVDFHIPKGSIRDA